MDATGQNPVAHIKQITQPGNEANRIIWLWIVEAYGGWLYDDGNNTNLPSATTALLNRSNAHKLWQDALTGIVWLDDSQIVEAHVFKGYDKEIPRIEITVELI